MDVASADAGTTSAWIFSGQSTSLHGLATTSAAWEVCMLTCWAIWKGCCRFVFEQRMPNTFTVVKEIQAVTEEVLRARTGPRNTSAQQ